jgi:uncharacterized protein
MAVITSGIDDIARRVTELGSRILSLRKPGSVAPDWGIGLALGVGGLAGAYTGARLQSHLPDALMRRLVGILVIAIGARYLWSGLA